MKSPASEYWNLVDEHKKLLEIVKEVFNLTNNPWDDALIDEELYNSMESLINKCEENKQ